MAAEGVYRQRAITNDVNTDFKGIPFVGASIAHVNDLNFSGRQSQINARVQGKLADVKWVQDEPMNMGPATFVAPKLEPVARARKATWEMIGRAESASPATGSHKAHVIEQAQILDAAFRA